MPPTSPTRWRAQTEAPRLLSPKPAPTSRRRSIGTKAIGYGLRSMRVCGLACGGTGAAARRKPCKVRGDGGKAQEPATWARHSWFSVHLPPCHRRVRSHSEGRRACRIAHHGCRNSALTSGRNSGPAARSRGGRRGEAGRESERGGRSGQFHVPSFPLTKDVKPAKPPSHIRRLGSSCSRRVSTARSRPCVSFSR
jgi:hypothetical protein